MTEVVQTNDIYELFNIDLQDKQSDFFIRLKHNIHVLNQINEIYCIKSDGENKVVFGFMTVPQGEMMWALLSRDSGKYFKGCRNKVMEILKHKVNDIYMLASVDFIEARRLAMALGFYSLKQMVDNQVVYVRAHG